MALAMLFMIGLSAMAQVTTGSIVGTVKDAQGGVVPGATVTLTSETKGTTSAPAITTVTGDFQFPVTPVDTYTVEITPFPSASRHRWPQSPRFALPRHDLGSLLNHHGYNLRGVPNPKTTYALNIEQRDF